MNETISKADLFKERIEQAKRIEELVNIDEKLSLALNSAEDRIEKAKLYIAWHIPNCDDLLNILKGE